MSLNKVTERKSVVSVSWLRRSPEIVSRLYKRAGEVRELIVESSAEGGILTNQTTFQQEQNRTVQSNQTAENPAEGLTLQPPMQPSIESNTQSLQSAYPYQNQPLNILISPSSIPNPNPSTLGKQLVYPAYGTYITYPIQAFAPFQTIQYPGINPLQNQQDNGTFIINMDQSASEATLINDPEKNNASIIIDNERIISSDASLNMPHESDRFQDNSTQIGVSKNTLVTSELDQKATKNMSANKEDKSCSANIVSEKKPAYRKINSVHNTRIGKLVPPIKPIVSQTNKVDNVFSLKTSIPISKIDMRSINSHNDVGTSKTMPVKPPGNEILESKLKEPQNSPILVLESNKGQLESQQQIFLKVDNKQNFFLQNNAVMHPQSIIKMPVASDTAPAEENTDTGVSFRGQLVNTLANQGIRENTFIVAAQNHQFNIGSHVSNFNTIRSVNETSNVCARTNRPLMTTRPLSDKYSIDASKGIINLQDSNSKELKKKFLLVPSSHLTNQLMLAISSKPSHPNSILISKGLVQDESNISNPLQSSPLLTTSKEGVQLVTTSPDTNSKVVALKRLHQDNYDENDFENLITENQIYGNKIVIKEKSHPIASKNCNIPSPQPKRIVQNGNPLLEVTTKPNLVAQPNFLYMSNINLQPNHNFMLLNKSIGNNQIITTEDTHYPGRTDTIQIGDKTDFTNQIVPQTKVMVSAQTFRTVNPATHTVSFVKENNALEPNKHGTVLQSLLNKSNVKVCEVSQQQNMSQIVNNQIVYQVPFFLDNNNALQQRRVNLVKPAFFNSELAMLLTKPANQFLDWKKNNISMTADVKLEPESIVKNEPITDITLKGGQVDSEGEVVSSIDLAEKRKILREKRKILARDKNYIKALTEKENCNTLREHERFLGSHYYYSDGDSDLQSDEDVETNKRKFTKKKSMLLDTGQGKLEFLNAFGLTTKKEKREKELERLERSLRLDCVNSACVAVVLEKLPKETDDFSTIRYGDQPISLPVPIITDNSLNMENIDKITDKIVFFNELKLGMVSQKYKIEHEKTWQTVVKDRKRRNGPSALIEYFEKTFEAQNIIPEVKQVKLDSSIGLHTRGQLEIMTRIKESVKLNNNLIKEKLDSIYNQNNNDYMCENNEIPLLAERNFSEISKLSNMANRSLNFLGIQQMPPKKEMVPFQNENAQNLKEQFQIVPQLSIPNVPRIISLKSTHDFSMVDISPATSMDEPRSSAACINVEDIGESTTVLDRAKTTPILHEMNFDERAQSFTSYPTQQVSPEHMQWPGIEAVLGSYRRFNDECEVERSRLSRENDQLKREIRAKEGAAGQLSNQMRILLMEQQICEDQRRSIQRSLDVINNCIKKILVRFRERRQTADCKMQRQQRYTTYNSVQKTHTEDVYSKVPLQSAVPL